MHIVYTLKHTLLLLVITLSCTTVTMSGVDVDKTVGNTDEHLGSTPASDSLAPLYIDSYSREPRTPQEATQFEIFISEHAPEDTAFIALQRLAAPMLRKGEFQKVAELYEKYQADFPNRQKSIATVLEVVRDQYPRYLIQNMGSAINTRGDEFSPVPAMRDYPMRLFFGVARRPDCRSAEDIFYSEYEVIRWVGGRPLANYGNNASDVPTAMNEAGTQMMLYRNTAPRGVMNFARCDKDTTRSSYPDSVLFKLTQQDGDVFQSNGRFLFWKQLSDFLYPVRSASFESDAQMVDNGKALLFVSDRPECTGTQVRKPTPNQPDYHGDRWGNTDIFVCIRTPDGWSKPINLGSKINTPFAERTPFLSSDGKTLYFASDGHPGLGRLDIYRSERINPNSWTEWTTPENLGKEVNSGDDDWGYRESFVGDSAFFASRNRADGFGGLDIYSAKLAPPPPRYSLVVGSIRDYYNQPLVADLRFMDATDDPLFIRSKTDSSGMFSVTLPRGRDYIWIGKREGYYPTTRNFRIKNADADSIITGLNMTLMPMHDSPERDTAVLHIENILFEYNSVAVRPHYVNQLQQIVDYLQNQPVLNIEVTGHTDSEGAAEYNQILSRRRAEAVRKFLVQLGCHPQRIKVTGLGFGKPLGNNDTEEGRALNRRVEIRLTN